MSPAIPSIQAGLDTAIEGDTVLVAAGTYFENIVWPAVNGIKLIGSGEEECTIDGSNTASVIRANQEIIDPATLITGFTVQNGYAQGDVPYSFGGGIYCRYSSPSLENVTINDNTATEGGGIYLLWSHPSLTNVTITDNVSWAFGGGIHSGLGSNPSMSDVMITGNSANYYGGGISVENSHPIMVNVIISNNSADEGGGIWGWHAITIENVTISGNSANEGGGLYCRAIADQFLRNIIVKDNWANLGGGLYCENSSPGLVNVTITGNPAEIQGGGIYCEESSHPHLNNCILWNNAPQEVVFHPDGYPNSITVSCSDIQGGEEGIEINDHGEVYWLENNIDENPHFCFPGIDNYRLQFDSPCRTDVCGFMGYTGETCDGEGVDDLIAEPTGFYLADAYPNPFNPSTTIEYSLATSGSVHLSVYNINGQLIDVVHDGFVPAGHHTATWSPQDLSSGVYLIELRSGRYAVSRKVMYLK